MQRLARTLSRRRWLQRGLAPCAAAVLFFAAVLSVAAESRATEARVAEALANGVPTTLARAGATVKAAIDGSVGDATTSVVLSAFGRIWTQPAAVAGGAAQVAVPAVRVTTVLDVVAADRPGAVVGRVVAYPEGKPPWDGAKVAVFAIDPPAWFSDWAAAVGATVRPALKSGQSAAEAAGPGAAPVLIVGRKAAGRTADELLNRVAEYSAPVIVLEADWLGAPPTKIPTGSPAARAVAAVERLGPDRMVGPLEGLRSERWPHVPNVSGRVPPWLRIMNRRPWITGNDGPLVEEVFVTRPEATALRAEMSAPHAEVSAPRPAVPVIVSYLPWPDMLGRTDVADMLLGRIVTTAAAAGLPRKDSTPRRSVFMRWPPAAEIKADSRPVLAAAIAANPPGEVDPRSDPEHIVVVLDLRSNVSMPKEVAAESIDRPLPEGLRLLILGDDAILDAIPWLKLNREKKTLGRPAATWLPEDALPPSPAAQVRLMEILTESGVALPYTKETDHAGKN